MARNYVREHPRARPNNYPKGLTVCTFPTASNRVQSLFIMQAIKHPETGKTTRLKTLVTEKTFPEVRKEALSNAAKMSGYKKVPAEWKKAVSDDWKTFLKQNRFKVKKVSIESFTPYGAG